MYHPYTSLCPTGYVPLTNPTVPITTSDSITVSWPTPPGAVVLENYILEYTIGQISGRRKRQTGSFNITIPASQTSYTLRDNVRPFTRYTFQVFANFGDGLVVLIVAPFSTQTGEARTLLYSSMVLTVWCMYLHNTYLYLDFLSDPLGTFGQFCTSFM